MPVKNQLAVSPEEYLFLERQSETKNEYYQGELICLAGAGEKHNIIVANVIACLHAQLKGRPCRVYPSDMRLKVRNTTAYTYPDVMVVCGKREFDDLQKDTILNPTVIIEVLSRSTEDIDRGRKFENYRQIESLKDYLLVSQDTIRAEHYKRQPDNQWLFYETSTPDAVVELESIQCRLPMPEIYDKVEE